VDRRRLGAAIFFSVVIVAVLGVIVGAEVVSSGQSVTVLRLRTAVQEGAAYSPADVEPVNLRLAPGDLNYVAPGSVPAGSRFSVALQPGDLLAPDDLVSGSAQIPITLTLADPPPIQPGEAIDLFAAVPGTTTEALIGHDLTVEQVNGDSVTLLVSSRDELAWLQVLTSSDSSGLKLFALAAVGPAPQGLAPGDVGQALCELAPQTCASVDAPPASPAPSTSSGPTAPASQPAAPSP
jgi:hypothetical protein